MSEHDLEGEVLHVTFPDSKLKFIVYIVCSNCDITHYSDPYSNEATAENELQDRLKAGFPDHSCPYYCDSYYPDI